MCKCTPTMRTLFCGQKLCVPPEWEDQKETVTIYKEEHDRLKKSEENSQPSFCRKCKNNDKTTHIMPIFNGLNYEKFLVSICKICQHKERCNIK